MTRSGTLQPASVQKIERIFIVGAGTMGCEIGFQCASHGVRVLLHDSAAPVLDQALTRMQKLARQLELTGQLQHDQVDAVFQRIETTPYLDAAAEAELVIECIPENLALKQRVFAALSECCRPETILATNTSSLIPSQLASSCRHPENLVAFHFHLPVATSNIVDLMPHPGTDPGVVESMAAFARSIGQIPIRYERECHAYIFNSIFGAMQRQALDLVIQGNATYQNVDRSWMGIFNMPVGPFGMFDGIGLDTIAEILSYWAETLNDDAGRKRVAFLRLWTDKGFLGAKTNRGFYTYPNPAYSQPGFLTRTEDRIG
jgi:3-hydroxybutyryl-CoA dehydrogenase